MSVKNGQTADFLRSAYGGESMAHMRYIRWADHAIKEGFPNIGRLYQAISYAEQVHANNHFDVLKQETGGHSVAAGGEFGIGTVAENLGWAIEGELGEVNQMYPVYLNAAKFQNEVDAQLSFHYALEAEKIHASMFQIAQDAAKAGTDYPATDDVIYICPVCGYTHIGEPPENCPVCAVKKSLFKSF
ncbi:MAG: rubrerythrin family protein [Negativicutes bacterium]|jgi:rubrerythrin|nr:rubrerythrin family protein [Negativicutes bacterium]